MGTGEPAPASQPRARSKAGSLLRWLAVFVLLVLLAASFGWRATYGRKKASEPYRLALQAVQQDPTVVERLGGPIRDVTWFPSGKIEGEGNQTTARFFFTIAGTKGEQAKVTVEARQTQEEWGFPTLQVLFAGGTRHSVQTEEDQGLETAPTWPPPGESETPVPEEQTAPTFEGAPPVAPPDVNLEIEVPTVPGREE